MQRAMEWGDDARAISAGKWISYGVVLCHFFFFLSQPLFFFPRPTFCFLYKPQHIQRPPSQARWCICKCRDLAMTDVCTAHTHHPLCSPWADTGKLPFIFVPACLFRVCRTKVPQAQQSGVITYTVAVKLVLSKNHMWSVHTVWIFFTLNSRKTSNCSHTIRIYNNTPKVSLP